MSTVESSFPIATPTGEPIGSIMLDLSIQHSSDNSIAMHKQEKAERDVAPYYDKAAAEEKETLSEHDELESTSVHWKVKRHGAEVKNYLEVVIERAIHLPFVEGVHIPSAFASLQWGRSSAERGGWVSSLDSDMEADSRTRTQPCAHTPTAPPSTSPEWNCGLTHPILYHAQNTRYMESENDLGALFRVPLVLGVWHRIPLLPPWDGSDDEHSITSDNGYPDESPRKNVILIGEAKIDLTSLPTLHTIDGWYHISDYKGRKVGQVKVKVNTRFLLDKNLFQEFRNPMNTYLDSEYDDIDYLKRIAGLRDQILLPPSTEHLNIVNAQQQGVEKMEDIELTPAHKKETVWLSEIEKDLSTQSDIVLRSRHEKNMQDLEMLSSRLTRTGPSLVTESALPENEKTVVHEHVHIFSPALSLSLSSSSSSTPSGSSSCASSPPANGHLDTLHARSTSPPVPTLQDCPRPPSPSSPPADPQFDYRLPLHSPNSPRSHAPQHPSSPSPYRRCLACSPHSPIHRDSSPSRRPSSPPRHPTPTPSPPRRPLSPPRRPLSPPRRPSSPPRRPSSPPWRPPSPPRALPSLQHSPLSSLSPHQHRSSSPPNHPHTLLYSTAPHTTSAPLQSTSTSLSQGTHRKVALASNEGDEEDEAQAVNIPALLHFPSVLQQLTQPQHTNVEQKPHHPSSYAPTKDGYNEKAEVVYSKIPPRIIRKQHVQWDAETERISRILKGQRYVKSEVLILYPLTSLQVIRI